MTTKEIVEKTIRESATVLNGPEIHALIAALAVAGVLKDDEPQDEIRKTGYCWNRNHEICAEKKLDCGCECHEPVAVVSPTPPTEPDVMKAVQAWSDYADLVTSDLKRFAARDTEWSRQRRGFFAGFRAGFVAGNQEQEK